MQAAVRGASGLTCSLGVGTCKVVAKVASDRRKPGGIVVVPPGREASFLAPFDVRVLPGVGPRPRRGCAPAGVDDRSASSPRSRTASSPRLLPGSVGALLRDRARGVDPRRLELAGRERLDLSQEETFARDVADRGALHDELRAHGASGSAEKLTAGRAARRGR